MEQISLRKIVSLHLDRCENVCSHASSCYHLKKDIIKNNTVSPTKLRKLLKDTIIIVYDSICSYMGENHIKDLLKWKYYNITLSCVFFNEISYSLEDYKDQLQITVYNLETINKFKEYQKLFLIKDHSTLDMFKLLLKKDVGRLHFVIDQDFLTKDILGDIVVNFNKHSKKGMSMDSCLTSWIVNGCCPYGKNNYIDITYDNTLRKCPFNKKGLNIKELSEDTNLFDLIQEPEKCVYKSYFQGENEWMELQN